MRNAQKMAPWMWLLIALVTLFIVGPILFSVYVGLLENYAQGLASGLTTRWIAEVWVNYGNTVWHSVLLALACVLLAMCLGVPCAYWLARSSTGWARNFEELLTLPVAIPGLATALALILAYGSLTSFRQSYAFVLVGHVVFTLPFLVRIVAAAFRRRELISLEEAARSLGASFVQRFFGILIPAVLPAIIAAALMVFTLSIGEFNLTWMLHTPTTRTLPVGLADTYSSMRIEIGSAYTIIFLLVILPVLWVFQTAQKLIEKHYGQ